eukprot:4373291-Pleurochrysis_carterae.AAC.3
MLFRRIRHFDDTAGTAFMTPRYMHDVQSSLRRNRPSLHAPATKRSTAHTNKGCRAPAPLSPPPSNTCAVRIESRVVPHLDGLSPRLARVGVVQRQREDLACNERAQVLHDRRTTARAFAECARLRLAQLRQQKRCLRQRSAASKARTAAWPSNERTSRDKDCRARRMRLLTQSAPRTGKHMQVRAHGPRQRVGSGALHCVEQARPSV